MRQLKGQLSELRGRLANYIADELTQPERLSGLFFSTNSLQVPIAAPNHCGLDGFTTEYAYSGIDKSEEIGIWYRPADKGKRTYILFHGREGNWGASGTGVKSKTQIKAEKEYPDTPFNDPGYRHQWLQALADRGFGVVAVHTRGFGASKNPTIKPLTSGNLQQDMEAVDVFLEEKGIDRREAVVAGESLGCALGALMCDTMDRNGHPPKMLALTNPFAKGSQAFNDEMHKLKIGSFPIFSDVSPEIIERNVGDFLNTETIIRKLCKNNYTRIYHVHALGDERFGPEHYEALQATAKETGIDYKFQALVKGGRSMRDHIRQHTAWDPKIWAEEAEAFCIQPSRRSGTVIGR